MESWIGSQITGEALMLPDTQPNIGILPKLLLLGSAVLLLLIHVFEPNVVGLWAQVLYNSLHVPVFGFIALSIYVATTARERWDFRKRALITFAAVFALSILSEAAQIPGPRDASLQDLVSDWLGATAALLFALAFDSGGEIKRRNKIAAAIAGTAILIFALSSLIVVSAAYAERSHQHPVLVSFSARFGHYFRRMQNASLVVLRDEKYGQLSGQITLNEGAWPGIIFHDIWPDWRDYSALLVEFHLDGDKPLDVNIRIHDQDHRLGEQPYDDRFNKAIRLLPGHNTLLIPLEEIRDAPAKRKMDLSQIHEIIIFGTRNEAGRAFQILEIRLQ